jgi:hypothetical protein
MLPGVVVDRPLASVRSLPDGWEHATRLRFLEQPNGRSHIRRALPKLSTQHLSEFVQQWPRSNHDAMTNAVLQQVAASAARNERGDEHVRIQQQFHETRLNTCSSVKMP